MVEIGKRYAVLEDPPDSRFGPWMREHKRVINGTIYLFFQKKNPYGKVVLITVARRGPGGFTDVKWFCY